MKSYPTIRNRVIYEGAIYHITQRAPGRELIFIDDYDYLMFISLLKKAVKKFKLSLFSFALLPNHVHLLLKINKENLSESMKYLFQSYAIYYNSKYSRKGHVFCGRYRSSLCNDNNYLLAASLYIHLNPYKAGLSEHYEDYPWSSLSLFPIRSKDAFISFRNILLLLDSNIKKARQQYGKMLESSANIAGGNLVDAKSVRRFIKKAIKITKKFYKQDPNLDELLDKFSAQKKIVNPKDKQARKYLVQQLLARGYTIKEICELLSISRKTYYNITHLRP